MVIGTIYRDNDFQIEKYYGSDSITCANLKWIDSRTAFIEGIKESKNPIDTLTWRINFRKIKHNEFLGIGTIAYSDFPSYEYQFKLKKTSNTIENDTFIKKIKKLLKYNKCLSL